MDKWKKWENWALAVFILGLSLIMYFKLDNFYTEFLKDTKMQQPRYQ